MKTTLAVAIVVSLAASVDAQVIRHDTQDKAEQHQLQLKIEQARASGVQIAVEPRTVTGMPYSGEAETETVQTLADGNRIVRRSTVRVYRDSEGRTRRETIGKDGQVTSVMINNPKTNTSFAFDPDTNTAHKTTAVTVVGHAAVGTTGGGSYSYTISDEGGTGTKTHARTVTGVALEKQKLEHEAQLKHAQEHATTIESTVTTGGPVTVISHSTISGPPPTKEDLGVQSFDGVSARGTRTKTVIPAGAVGNEQPMTVVNEEWYSPELQVLVMTKHSHPLAGDTTYRLTNIVRSEPDASLFELPARHTVK